MLQPFIARLPVTAHLFLLRLRGRQSVGAGRAAINRGVSACIRGAGGALRMK